MPKCEWTGNWLIRDDKQQIKIIIIGLPHSNIINISCLVDYPPGVWLLPGKKDNWYIQSMALFRIPHQGYPTISPHGRNPSTLQYHTNNDITIFWISLFPRRLISHTDYILNLFQVIHSSTDIPHRNTLNTKIHIKHLTTFEPQQMELHEIMIFVRDIHFTSVSQFRTKQ